MITVSQIWKYPLKSAKGLSLAGTAFDSEGMCDDRRLVALNKDGVFVTARQHSRLLQVSCVHNDEGWLLECPSQNKSCQIVEDSLSETIDGSLWKDKVHALDAGDEAAQWLSEVLDFEVRIAIWKKHARFSNKYQIETSFSDASPILVTSEASIQRACEWANMEPEVRRFRPNIVVTGVEAFAEDAWQVFKIGSLEFEVLDPCARCILTTVDPDTTERHPEREPMVSLMKRHANDSGQPLFGVNVRLRALVEGASIAVGDEVQIQDA